MRTPLAAASLLGLAALLAACSSAGATTAPTEAPATTAPTEAPAASQGGAPAAAAVAVATSSLGDILTGDGGLTLYVFLPDAAGAPTCYDTCAASWPPLLADGTPTLGDGLTGSDFGTAARTDGGSQVTFHGWPLYYFAGDQAAGDVNGQGLNDKWFVVGPDGTMIGAPAASEARPKY